VEGVARQAQTQARQGLVAPAKMSKGTQLPGVIAVIGCDGSGKSTLTADLIHNLRDGRRIEFIYLGQSSGHIGQQIQRLPLVGPAFGRYLARKAERVHEHKTKPPDAASALVIYLLSAWRAHKFKRMLRLCRRGVVVVTDRYPQAEVAGFKFDGPGLDAATAPAGLVRRLALREQRLYGWMASHVPALVIRLNIDAETAHARKPDHRLETLREKARVIPGLSFNGAPMLDLDARHPYAQVLEAALRAANAALAASSKPVPAEAHR